MQEAGKIINFSKNKTFIVKSASALDLRGAVKLLGKTLVTRNSKKVGRVNDIFGPLKSPYFSLKPFQNNSKDLIGQHLYIGGKKGVK